MSIHLTLRVNGHMLFTAQYKLQTFNQYLAVTHTKAGSSSLSRSHPQCNPMSDLSLCGSAQQPALLTSGCRDIQTHTQGKAVCWAEPAHSFYLLSSGNPFHSVRKLALLVGQEEKNSHPILLPFWPSLPSSRCSQVKPLHIRTHSCTRGQVKVITDRRE